ncbi:helix-turn-helix transcriptional regulator [Rhodococcus sp. T2V]|uniref:helix-turn-helix transcriptional regulator n=1 Tax=Rhodococcus sp. T2V TaxID=3034164 RepID=UPI0023E15D4E|nr:helix-turn-helix transcriptional regulator [Rhodococcus sp. T2V]MDF3308766.1 helix-turn-helix transcriptional regulator [Rhodococcus sp. T2V]
MKRSRPPRRRKEFWMKVKDPAKIRRWRKQRHYSQDQLAYLVHRSQQSISLIERGEMRSISEEFAIAIAARLDVPWEDLFEAHEIEVGTVVTSAVHSNGNKVPA